MTGEDHLALAWRVAGMDDLRWRKLTASHELEVILLKSILEQEDDGRA